MNFAVPGRRPPLGGGGRGRARRDDPPGDAGVSGICWLCGALLAISGLLTCLFVDERGMGDVNKALI